MAVNGLTGAKYLLTRIGNPYSKEDCVHAVVINLIRNNPGGDRGYRTSGCTELWNSYDIKGKYHHIVERRTIKEAIRDGLLIGDLPVIYNSKTDTCEHIAYYMGGVGGYECVHSSFTNKCVCGTTLSNGFTHVLRHKMIEGVPVSTNTDHSEHHAEDKYPMNKPYKTLYKVVVSTNGGALNLRQHPSTKSDVITEVPYGEVMDVVSETNDYWLEVVYNGQSGFVSASYTSVLEDRSPPVPSTPVTPPPTRPPAGERIRGIMIYCGSENEAQNIFAGLHPVVQRQAQFVRVYNPIEQCSFDDLTSVD